MPFPFELFEFLSDLRDVIRERRGKHREESMGKYPPPPLAGINPRFGIRGFNQLVYITGSFPERAYVELWEHDPRYPRDIFYTSRNVLEMTVFRSDSELRVRFIIGKNAMTGLHDVAVMGDKDRVVALSPYSFNILEASRLGS
jgi:hypothetical protein